MTWPTPPQPDECPFYVPEKSDSCLAPATVHLSSEEWRRLRTFSFSAGYDFCPPHAAVVRAEIARVIR